MSKFKNPGYMIDRPEPSEIFLNARHIAGSQLQGEFNKNKGQVPDSRDYKWIKAEMTYPSFDHITFGYGNQVFSVLVDLCDIKGSHLTDKERDRFIKATTENNLVPCLFSITLPELRPLHEGWNLTHFTSGKPVIPADITTNENIPMSEWELHNFAIQIVRNYIVQEKIGTILSFCDVLQINPQIWFDDLKGNRAWVIVRHIRRPNDAEITNCLGFEKTNPQIKEYDGYFAGVSFASSATVLYDLEGNIIPPSKRFTGSAPLYRGDVFFVNFQGLQRIHVTTNGTRKPGQKDITVNISPLRRQTETSVNQQSSPKLNRKESDNLPEGARTHKLDACRAFARMMNTLDSSHSLPWLEEDCKYTSQWVKESINGSAAYLTYLRGKLNSIKRTGRRVWAEIAYTDVLGTEPCVMLSQTTRDNLVAMLLLKINEGKISEMKMCNVPSMNEYRMTGEFPE